ncbi:glycosyl hydrolase 108 family protein [Agrobacterium sp.]|uniref:glycoside hydrolase family 108 protein n=1 Tax=Agrobacterium sp. TaxID=361 RepID=UPI00289E06A1|nr:glycosyl hydrolase 108 family protein [Agrobacterium sp.]
MAASTYKTAVAHLRRDEGGYVNHPKDPGGATNYGITQAVYDAYRKRIGLKTRSVRETAEVEVSSIYQTQYADKVRYDALPAGVDYATLDAAVNSGVSRGAKWLQLAIGVTADGVVGNQTVASAAAADPVKTVKAICARRLSFVQSLKTWSTFGKGWSRRIAGVEANATKMSLAARGGSERGIAAHLKAEATTARKDANTNAATATTSAASGAGSTVGVDLANLDSVTTIALIVVAVGLVGFAVYLFRKSKINRDRAAAYAAVAEGA